MCSQSSLVHAVADTGQAIGSLQEVHHQILRSSVSSLVVHIKYCVVLRLAPYQCRLCLQWQAVACRSRHVSTTASVLLPFA